MFDNLKKRVFGFIGEYSKQVVWGCGLITAAGIFMLFVLMGRIGRAQAAGIQEGIADEIIRFHVLANSDSDEDQELKMLVKEEVVGYLHEILKGAVTVDDTRDVILEHMDEIVVLARQLVEEQGYSYEVTAEVLKCYFPMKSYGDVTFPAGDYEALRVCIGDAEGQNWWCVLYPNLCFIDSIHAVVPEDQKEELRNVLTEDEYDSLFSWKGSDVRVKVKVLEWFR